MSHVEARATAVGKQVAGTLSPIPGLSAEATGLRSPWGPSVTMIDGTPARSIGVVVQKSRPEVSDAFSSRESRARACSTSKTAAGPVASSVWSELGMVHFLGSSNERTWLLSSDRRPDTYRLVGLQVVRTVRAASGCPPPVCWVARQAQTAMSRMTGTWSDAPLPLRSFRSISTAVTRGVSAGEV